MQCVSHWSELEMRISPTLFCCLDYDWIQRHLRGLLGLGGGIRSTECHPSYGWDLTLLPVELWHYK